MIQKGTDAGPMALLMGNMMMMTEGHLFRGPN
jgi:hypothetical protein